MADIAGWPHWEIQFDRAGNTDAATRTALLDQIRAAGLTDVLVMSHGWGAGVDHARQLYQQWFGMLPRLLPHGSTARPGTIGVLWPSLLWADNPPPGPAAPAAGGAAGLAEPSSGDAQAGAPVLALTAAYPDPGQQQILGELAALLNEQSTDPQALDRFQEQMRAHSATEPETIAAEDAGPPSMLNEDPLTLASRFAAALDEASGQLAGGSAGPGGSAPAADEGGAADLPEGGAAGLPDITPPDTGQGAAGGIGSITSRLWNGAKSALQEFTYWQMKRRAGLVGQRGLGPLINDLASGTPDLRVHLIGHSFGGRLVSFSLAGLAGPAAGRLSPVRSVTLLEGAFSHFAFTSALPFDPAEPGALKGMTQRVDGPLIACYSSHDTALGVMYPIASLADQDDASGLTDDVMSRWGAIGHDGAQAVHAAQVTLKNTGQRYTFASGQFTNIDTSAVVCHGDPPSGAHSDIVHPELGWAMLSAAGLV